MRTLLLYHIQEPPSGSNQSHPHNTRNATSYSSSQPVGRDTTEVKYQIFTLRLIAAAKLQLWGRNENNFMVGWHQKRQKEPQAGNGEHPRRKETGPDGVRRALTITLTSQQPGSLTDTRLLIRSFPAFTLFLGQCDSSNQIQTRLEHRV